MKLEELTDKLRRIEEKTNQEWMNSLDERKKRELEFHDLVRDDARAESLAPEELKKEQGNLKYYSIKAGSEKYLTQWIQREARDRIFLDYCCGRGGSAIKAAKAGAKLVVGIDISPVAVAHAKRRAETEGVEGNTFFVQADAENTMLPDDSIDAVVCSGVLHHLDVNNVFPELCRILAPGGKILAAEALKYNPFIQLYRKLTPRMRTEWETAHILGLKELRFARQLFDVGEVRYWYILSLAGAFVRFILPVLNAFDWVLTRIPLVRLMAWQFTFELKSRKKSQAS